MQINIHMGNVRSDKKKKDVKNVPKEHRTENLFYHEASCMTQ